MTTDNLGWLLPAWLLGAPLLLGLYELATMRSRRERVYGSSAHLRDTGGVPADRRDTGGVPADRRDTGGVPTDRGAGRSI